MIDLLPFCAKEWHDIDRPFAHDGYTFATNRHLCIRVKGEHVEDKCPPHVNIALAVEQFSGEHIAPQPLRPLRVPTISEPCESCEGTGKVHTCPECDGEGEVSWDSGFHEYSHDCQTCNGHGTVSQPIKGSKPGGKDCEACDGTGKLEHCKPKYITIGLSQFQSRYINLLADHLPEDATIAPSKRPTRAALIQWSGGDGVIMPTRGSND